MALKRGKRLSPETLYIIRQVVRGVLIVLAISLLLTAVWYGTRVSSLTIASVSVVGGVTIDRSMVKEKIEAELEGEYYRLVPRRFAWLYPRKTMIDSVLTIDRIEEVRIERRGTELIAAFTEFVPYALWCDDPESVSCLFLDKKGYAFAAAPMLSGGSFIRYVDLARTPEKEQYAFSAEVLSMVEAYESLLQRQLGFYVVAVEFDSVGDAFLTFAGGEELKVTMSDVPSDVVDNLVTLLASEEFAHLRSGGFGYIDLRFGERVYVYEEPEVIESIASSSEEAVVE